MKKFNVILIDPPWKFSNYDYETAKRGAKKEYPTMSLEQLKLIPINKICDENCIMFMWVPDTHISEMLELFNSWDFKYKTKAFTWIKTTKAYSEFKLFLNKPISELLTLKRFPKFLNLAKSMLNPRMGMGKYTRKETESCYIGIKGKIKVVKFDVRECIFAEKEEHSKKPLETKKRIDDLLGPNVNKVEIFARFTNKIDDLGWYNMGHGVDDKDIIESINNLKFDF